MRAAGVLLLFISAAAAGVFRAREYRKQVKLLTALCAVLTAFKSEIVTRRTPVFAALETACVGGELEFFAERLKTIRDSTDTVQSFAAIWAQAAGDCLTALPDDCFEAVLVLGGILGRYDADMQAEAIDRCLGKLTQSSEEHGAKLKDRERLCIALSSGIGLIAAIVLI